MKRASTISAIAILTGSALVAHAGESTGGIALGTKVPAAVAKTKMKNVDGKLVSIADVTGKAGTLVVFTCNHCPFAKAWEQRLVELANTYAGKGVGVVLVNANDPKTHAEDGFEEMQARAKSRGMKIPYVVDDTSAVARAFGASVTPEAFLFDKTGKLAYHGTIDDNRNEPDKVTARYLKDALDAVVAGKKPPVAETKGLGCGIKFRS
ncbi:MAG TPA: thioredoxin family protein [Polyangia bacterium]|nr:thioredoxin family protein [Polyangia bacterium]